MKQYMFKVISDRVKITTLDCFCHSNYFTLLLCSFQFSCSVVSGSLWPHGLQHARLPCPSSTPRACSNSCPLSQWCHSTISVVPFSSCLQSFPESGSFQWVSSSCQVADVLQFQLQHQSFQWIFRTVNIPLGKVGSPCSPRGSQESPPTLQFKSINSLALSFLYCPTLTFIHGYWKNHSVESLLFNMLSIVVITFLPRSKRLLILWLQSPPAVILEPQNNKVCHCFHCFLSICHEVMGLDAMILVFWMLSYKPAFSLTSFPFIKRLFSMQPLLVIPITNATPLFPVTQMGNTYRDSPLCQALCWAPSWNMFLLIIILKAKYFPFLTL